MRRNLFRLPRFPRIKWKRADAMFPGERAALIKRLQRKGISDPRVLEAIGNTPRELFMQPNATAKSAYTDAPFAISCGQTISQPFVVAYMTERLRIHGNQEVFEVGTGSGYQTAILARLARHVYTIERHAELHNQAQSRFEHLRLTNITAVVGDGNRGWPERRRFPRIIVTAGTPVIPEPLFDQLDDGGLMIVPVGRRDAMRLHLLALTHGRVETQELLPVRFVPLVSGVENRRSCG
jgi:protein-L-isoaspartate(D-aspartate) O-methyltransferase